MLKVDYWTKEKSLSTSCKFMLSELGKAGAGDRQLSSSAGLTTNMP